MYLVCNQQVSVLKECNIRRYYETHHKEKYHHLKGQLRGDKQIVSWSEETVYFYFQLRGQWCSSESRLPLLPLLTSWGVFTPALFGSTQTKKKITGADLLGLFEYKPWNSGADQTVGPRPSRRDGLGSLPSKPWCSLLDLWKWPPSVQLSSKNVPFWTQQAPAQPWWEIWEILFN